MVNPPAREVVQNCKFVEDNATWEADAATYALVRWLQYWPMEKDEESRTLEALITYFRSSFCKSFDDIRSVLSFKRLAETEASTHWMTRPKKRRVDDTLLARRMMTKQRLHELFQQHVVIDRFLSMTDHFLQNEESYGIHNVTNVVYASQITKTKHSKECLQLFRQRHPTLPDRAFLEKPDLTATQSWQLRMEYGRAVPYDQYIHEQFTDGARCVCIDDYNCLQWPPSKEFLQTLAEANIHHIVFLDEKSQHTTVDPETGITIHVIDSGLSNEHVGWHSALQKYKGTLQELLANKRNVVLSISNGSNYHWLMSNAKQHHLKNHNAFFSHVLSVPQLLTEDGILNQKEFRSVLTRHWVHFFCAPFFQSDDREGWEYLDDIRGCPRGWDLQGSVLEDLSEHSLRESYGKTYDGIILFPVDEADKGAEELLLRQPTPSESLTQRVPVAWA